MTAPVTESLIRDLLANLGRYLANLARAGRQRREESRKALQGVVHATRRTRVYIRQLRAKGKRDFDKEEHLSRTWTDLSFELDKLDVKALAKRCDITGRYWSDPDEYSNDFLHKAGVRLGDLELEARGLLARL